ncbi:MAG: HDOD domain-containing protein [Gammaproteobacteria bacterium]|nr:HDOD domain-containing protein [Gammaproteobacteria bacterium]MCW8987208.1 HDOD domain-containing protein [Gammaproteobacteria bacterium]
MTSEALITQENIEAILKGITIPSPPQVIADLQMEMAMPSPDLNEMADMISKDPGLAGGVLKTLNSPFYGNRDIGSISKAVMMLGMNTIANIVNTLYLRDSMSQQDDIADDVYKAMTRFWDSATDVARACELIAQRLRYNHPDMAYMLGLFHNAGIPLLMQRFPDYPQVIAESYLLEEHRIVDCENKHYMCNHAVVSFYAARSWKLPPLLCKVIAEHHSAVDIFTEKDRTDPDEKYLLAILKMGEHLAGLPKAIGNNDEDLEWQQIEDVVLEYLGLSSVDYDDLVAYASDNGIGGQTYFM